ncbi:hypothetical protein ER308_20340 [Egibacter rhizosphaerae]|uniref:Four-carbon acid sugar kinase nucleotide binding domain-containing protein n=1 Tax=Egibacter rhizosphaerae TaxID=1670831 RepID=A0A411YKD8_9ACTN|nr:nucleotide-binding domain containing protein [Egibacter rhizosphaerae]QBI21684.1 hypothetical protein ER308_20340 [Egibacter rhizosphaerae]
MTTSRPRPPVPLGSPRRSAGFPVDPGPLAVELAEALGLRPALPPALVVAGSVTEVTRHQLDRLATRPGTELVRTSPASLDVDRAVAELLAAFDRGAQVVALTTADGDEPVVDLASGEAERVAESLGALVRAVLDARSISGVYVTGGDVTEAALDALDATALLLEAEIEPLAVQGRVVDGPWDGVPVATKGGLIGGPQTAAACVDALRTAARAYPRTEGAPTR